MVACERVAQDIGRQVEPSFVACQMNQAVYLPVCFGFQDGFFEPMIQSITDRNKTSLAALGVPCLDRYGAGRQVDLVLCDPGKLKWPKAGKCCEGDVRDGFRRCNAKEIEGLPPSQDPNRIVFEFGSRNSICWIACSASSLNCGSKNEAKVSSVISPRMSTFCPVPDVSFQIFSLYRV